MPPRGLQAELIRRSNGRRGRKGKWANDKTAICRGGRIRRNLERPYVA